MRGRDNKICGRSEFVPTLPQTTICTPPPVHGLHRAHHRRVQKALTDHLIFMTEDAVEAGLNRQSRVDGEEVIEGSNKSSVAGVPGPDSEPDQLLVLIGDAGGR